MLARVGRALLPDPFLALFALRRRYFAEQSHLLYKRYGHALGIFGAFFALVLVERPSLLAAPILQFWRDPLDWRANLGHVIGWLVVVALWARVHRGFVRGAAFAVFARTSRHGYHLASTLDLALLLVALQWFAIPFAIGAWVVVAAGTGTLLFWACFAVMLLLTLALARAAVFGAGRARCLRLLAASGLLVAAPLAAGWPLAACLGLLAFDLARPVAPRTSARRDDSATGILRGPGLWFLFVLQCRALLRSHGHVVLPRVGLAPLLHALAWLLIYRFNKQDDAAGLIKLACCAGAYALAGLYYAFWEARQRIEPFLRSLPFGVPRILVAEHLAVLGLGAVVAGLAWVAHAQAPAGSPDLTPWLLRSAGLSLVLLALLGAPLLQRHPYGVVMKIALTVTALLLM